MIRKPGRPKNPDLKQRREAEILGAAAELFADQGFAQTHVQAIADRLGVGNGTIFAYFPTKEAIFLAVVERGLADLTAIMDEVMAREGPPSLLLPQVIRAYLQFFHDRPELAEMFIQERANFPHHHRPLYFSTKQESECRNHDAFYRRLVDAGVLRPMPQESFMAVVGDLLYGTIITNLLSGRVVDPEAQTAAVLDVLGFGIFSEAERKRRAEPTT